MKVENKITNFERLVRGFKVIIIPILNFKEYCKIKMVEWRKVGIIYRRFWTSSDDNLIFENLNLSINIARFLQL